MDEYKTEGPTRHEEVKENGVTPHQRGGVINTLYPPGPRGGAGARMKNHCRKFWWCDLLLTAIIILVITLPVVYVAIPHKAQHDINASTLSVSSQEVTNPQQNSVQLKIDSVAHSSSSFHPTLEAFKAGFSLKDQPAFLFVDLPETKAESETPISVNQTVQIANMDQFKEYNKVVIGSESFDVYVSGKTKVHQSGLKPISVDYNKKVTMKGLNKLQGLNITDVQILFGEGKTLPDGSNMIGNVIIPNPSVMTIDLGNVTMNLYVDGKSIGTSLLPNMQLKPGTNNCSMQSTVAQLDVVQMITTKYKDAILPITIQGNSSVINGKHLEYFESAIQANNITVNLNVGPALAAIGLNVTSSS